MLPRITSQEMFLLRSVHVRENNNHFFLPVEFPSIPCLQQKIYQCYSWMSAETFVKCSFSLPFFVWHKNQMFFKYTQVSFKCLSVKYQNRMTRRPRTAKRLPRSLQRHRAPEPDVSFDPHTGGEGPPKPPLRSHFEDELVPLLLQYPSKSLLSKYCGCRTREPTLRCVLEAFISTT